MYLRYQRGQHYVLGANSACMYRCFWGIPSGRGFECFGYVSGLQLSYQPCLEWLGQERWVKGGLAHGSFLSLIPLATSRGKIQAAYPLSCVCLCLRNKLGVSTFFGAPSLGLLLLWCESLPSMNTSPAHKVSCDKYLKHLVMALNTRVKAVIVANHWRE